MEDMNVKDIMPVEETMEEAIEAATIGDGLKTVATIGVIGATCVAAWEIVIKPVGRKAKQKIDQMVANHKVRKIKEKPGDDVTVENVTIDDIPKM